MLTAVTLCRVHNNILFVFGKFHDNFNSHQFNSMIHLKLYSRVKIEVFVAVKLRGHLKHPGRQEAPHYSQAKQMRLLLASLNS